MAHLSDSDGLEPYDLMVASILDFIYDDVPQEALHDLCVLAENELEFFAGMQAMVDLGDIIKDHYDRKEDSTNGSSEENIKLTPPPDEEDE